MGTSTTGRWKTWQSRFLRRAWRWWRDKPLLLFVAGAILPLIVEQLAPEFVAMVAAAFHLSKLMTLLLFAAILGGLAAGSLLYAVARIPDDPVSEDLLESDYERLTHLDDQGVDQVQDQLIKPLFGDAHPDAEEIRKMYRKNPVMGVAIHSREEDAVVAFACAWPLSVDAAKRLLAGRITENELKADDILPASSNRRATHLLVPVVVVRDPGTKEGVKQNWALRSAFKESICKIYFGDKERAITFVATGFSEVGRRLCSKRGMTEVARVEMDGEKLPIYCRTLKRAEFERAF